MNYSVFRLLDQKEAESVVSVLSQEHFADGRKTAHGIARQVKNNLQVERSGPEVSDADRILVPALQRSTELRNFAYPKRIMAPMYSRYEPGMEYGSHVDNGIMSVKNSDPLRTDVAMTVFLSPPSSYDGGELVIEMPIGEQEIKLDAGEAIAYSATSIHHVNPVTRGVRMAARSPGSKARFAARKCAGFSMT